ncbi:MAG: hypothetical protein QW620_00985 [Thermoplasmata archaeon]
MGLRDKAKEKLAEISEGKTTSQQEMQKIPTPPQMPSQTQISQLVAQKDTSEMDKQRMIIVKIKQELEARRKELIAKEEELLNKEKEIANKSNEIEAKSAELRKLHEEIERKRREIEEELAVKTKEVGEKEEKILAMEQELIEKVKKLEEKEKAIAQLEENLRTRMVEVAKMEEKTVAAIGEIVTELSDLGITREAFENLMNTSEAETKRLLIVLDELLGELPDETIEKFAKSPDYRLYEKVLKMYGI